MLTVGTEFRKGILFVRLKGDLNKENVDKLNKRVTSVVKDSGIRNIVFNFSNLKSIDIKGINTILYNYELCRNNKGRSLMCGNNDNIRKKLKKTRLINYIYETPDELSAINFKNYKSKEDLFQAGCLGLINAYKKYDPSMNCKFTTYVYPYILGEMRKLVRQDKGLKISREITKLNLKIEKAYVLLTQKLMKEPTITEVADYLNVPEFYVSEAINSLNKIKSIDEPINSDGKEFTLQDVVGKMDNIDDLIMLKESLKTLNKEEMELISNRYIKDYTQTQTSKIIGMSQVQVSRKEQKVLQKLKQKMVA